MHKASIYEMSMTQLDIKFLLYTHLPWVVQGKDVAMSVPTLPPHTLSHLNPIHEVRKREEERYILIALSSSGGGGGGGGIFDGGVGTLYGQGVVNKKLQSGFNPASPKKKYTV